MPRFFIAATAAQKAAWRRAPPPEPLIEVMPGIRTSLVNLASPGCRITHSTPETCALLIETDDCRILHTADWKIDTRLELVLVGLDPWKAVAIKVSMLSFATRPTQLSWSFADRW